jgi:hypothetical protein
MNTKQQIAQDWAFWRGVMDGLNQGPRSARQTLTDYPWFDGFELSAYLNGNDDGVANDLFRVNLLID